MQSSMRIINIPTDIAAFILLMAGVYYFYMLDQYLEVLIVCLLGIMYLLIRILYILPALVDTLAYKIQVISKSKL